VGKTLPQTTHLGISLYHLSKSIYGDLGDGLFLFKSRKKNVFPSLKFSLEGQKSQCFQWKFPLIQPFLESGGFQKWGAPSHHGFQSVSVHKWSNFG